ncbi:MAG TPA: glycosyltransferase family 87 protein [Gemmataceae bacterium]|nr:glycosyltransferase family 87 protein [Gemmataceae bacterium]
MTRKSWEASRRHMLTMIGMACLIAWGVWWTACLRQNHLIGAQRTWIPAWQESLGLDFLNNYHASRHWLAGGDVYREPFGDPMQRRFCYPPCVLPLFAWCAYGSPRTAVRIWTVSLILAAGFGVWCACHSRRQLHLWPVPVPFALASMLFSAPFLFALERGNYDTAVVPLLILAACALTKRSGVRDLAAGTCLAVAAGMKVYPAFVLFGLLPLRRYRALACSILVGSLILSFHFQDLPQFWANVQDLIARQSPLALGGIAPVVHTLSSCWPLLWRDTPWAILSRIPGTLAALGLLAPLVLLISYRIFHCPSPRSLLLPYLLWLAAAATFLPPISIDYNLVFLPLACIAVWDRRDPVAVHLCMAFTLLWAQPIGVPIGPVLLLGFKYLTLAAVAVSLANRAQEQAALGSKDGARAVDADEPVPVAA